MAAINPLPPSSWSRNRKPDFHYSSSSSSSSRIRKLSHSILTVNSKLLSDSRLSSDFDGFEIQFFVKLMISGVKTLVLRANYSDTIETVFEKVYNVTGIPLHEQRLIYNGKQLHCEQTLKDCAVENDSVVQLVGRMRSTVHPIAWRMIDDIVSNIREICKNKLAYYVLDNVKNKLSVFIELSKSKRMNFVVDNDGAVVHNFGSVVGNVGVVELCRIFMDVNAPQAFVMLYMSNDVRNRDYAEDCIRSFVSFLMGFSEDRVKSGACACVVLEFCKFLKGMSTLEDPLYAYCRRTLGYFVKNLNAWVEEKKDIFSSGMSCVTIQDVFPFLKELGDGLVISLTLNTKCGHTSIGFSDFKAFLRPVLGFIFTRSKSIKREGEEAKYVSYLFTELVSLIGKGLIEIEKNVIKKREKDSDLDQSRPSEYLSILEELGNVSELFPDFENEFSAMMRRRKVAIRSLIVSHAKRDEDYGWILNHRELLDSESRSHLALLMFPKVKENYNELHEMMIDRSKLLAESFEYISLAKPSSLHGVLFMAFKNEVATGPGVLREWFCLVCQAIFDPLNALFVACPEDCQKLFPNPASKVNPKHLPYFCFAGRIIALALMHKIQVGVVLDRTFFLHLAGRHILLEDILDADPYMHNSLKQILEMDANSVDSDCLGLTFVTEVEEFGTRKVVELLKGGGNVVVNSFNRKEYVDLIIKQRFVSSVVEQVSAFGKGFSDILVGYKTEKDFFGSLEVEDVEWMLRGSGSEICVKDWKAHTDYKGYRKNSRQITSFWKVCVSCQLCFILVCSFMKLIPIIPYVMTMIRNW